MPERKTQMKLMIYGQRMDEVPVYEKLNEQYGFEIGYEENRLCPENAALASGYDAAAVSSECSLDAPLCGTLSREGIRYILARSSGVFNIDLDAAHELGMKVANVPRCSPEAISEHTVMLLLMLLRKMKTQMKNVEEQDFRLQGLRGRELSSLTVGVIGAGRVGSKTIRLISGFGSRVLAYDICMHSEIERYATYVPLDDLFARSDAIILHAPLIARNVHMIDAEAIRRMKDGVILINTARGGLVDTRAVYEGLLSGKIGGFGFDGYENGRAVERRDLRGQKVQDPLLSELTSMDQVIYTTHTAFYTDEAVADIARVTLQNLKEFSRTGRCVNQK